MFYSVRVLFIRLNNLYRRKMIMFWDWLSIAQSAKLGRKYEVGRTLGWKKRCYHSNKINNYIS